MSRDSGSEHPSQRTVAELLAEHGGGSQRSARRRRRRAEDPTETAPQAIINRVNSDSGRMRPVPAEDETTQSGAASSGTPAPEEVPPPPQASPAVPPASPPRKQAAAPHGGQETTESPHSSGGSGFWARRFSHGANGSGSAAAPVNRPEQAADSPSPDVTSEQTVTDAEITAQQPVVAQPPEPPRSSPAPAAQVAPAPGTTGRTQYREGAAFSPARPETEGATEQFPPVHGTVTPETAETNGTQQPAAEAGDTAMPAYPPAAADPYAPVTGYQDPYYSFDYDESYETGYGGAYGDTDLDEDDADGYGYGYDARDFDDADDGYGDTDLDDEDDPDPPAGMDAEDYLDEDVETDGSQRSPAKEWLLLATQVGAGLLGGGAVWIGFRWLWTTIPVAALVAALVVTGALVLIARRFLRTDDLQTILLAVLVGLVCTVSPAALLLVGY